MKEGLRHIEAFEYYYTLGSSRSYSKVAKEFGVALRTVEKWGKELKWGKRVEERDKVNGKRLETITNDTILEDKIRYHKVIKMGISSFLNNLKEGKVEVDNVKDFATLVKLDLELMGSMVVEDAEDSKIEIVFEGKGV